MKPKLPAHWYRVTMLLEASARLPEETFKRRVAARSQYRALLWGLQALNGGQRKRVRSAMVDGPFEQVDEALRVHGPTTY